MPDDHLFAEHPPDNEQRFDQWRQVGEILDKVLDARLEPHFRKDGGSAIKQVCRGPGLSWRDPCRSMARALHAVC
jgi:hypothetical protein